MVRIDDLRVVVLAIEPKESYYNYFFILYKGGLKIRVDWAASSMKTTVEEMIYAWLTSASISSTREEEMFPLTVQKQLQELRKRCHKEALCIFDDMQQIKEYREKVREHIVSLQESKNRPYRPTD